MACCSSLSAASSRMAAVPSTSASCSALTLVAPAAAPLRSSRSSSRRCQSSALVVRAAQLPQGVTAPPRVPQKPMSVVGFVPFAEKVNSRAAMLGFFGILLVEAVAHKGIFELAGFEVGKGLGFEF